MAEEENLRTYSFPVPGHIPGIPGYWPGGSRVTINEDTMQVVDAWTGNPLPPALEEIEPQNVSPQEPQAALPVEEESTASMSLEDAVGKLGGN